MHIIRVLGLVMVLTLVAFAGEPAEDAAPLVSGNTSFACDLYARLQARDGNLFFSPYSISACLAMTREGARGDTATEMDAVFHFPARGMGEGFHHLDEALEPPTVTDGWGQNAKEVSAYELTVANRLWGQQGYTFRKPFLDRLAEVYGASLAEVDFHHPVAVRAAINGWIEKETHDKIKDMIPEGLPTTDTRLVLANAVYFKSQWKDPFRERATVDAPFHCPGAADVEARMMRRVGRYGYGAADGVQILEMPYRGREMSMVVVLPRATDGLEAVEAKLTPETLAGWLGGLESVKVDVTFPRFKFTSGFDLTGTLREMGMADAFSLAKANFSGMTVEEPLFIGVVLHKAFVAVDEKGTEAAAATIVGMRAGAAAPTASPVVFKADHPFLFLIRHRETGTILFVGRVVDPT